MKVSFGLLGGLLVLVAANFASAQPFQGFLDVPPPPQTGSEIIGLVEGVIRFLGFLLGALAVLAIFISAFYFMTAGDSQDRASKAKSWLKWGIVGIVVALFAVVIVPLVSNLLAGGFF